MTVKALTRSSRTDATAGTPAQDDDQASRFPRREKRKLETRRRVISVAGRLFEEKGYSDATMAAIAEAAEIHVTTLFTHFKSKHELSEAVASHALEQLSVLITENQGRTPFFQFQRELVSRVAGNYERKAPHKISIGRLFGKDPDVTATWLDYEQRQVKLLAGYIAHDFGLDAATDCRPTLVANMLVGGNIFAHQRWVASGGASDLKGECLAALDAVERIVESGLKATSAR